MLDTINNTKNLYHNAAILEKDGVFSVIALSATPGGIIVLGRNDPRPDAGISRSRQDGPAKGYDNFERSIKHSQANGWKLVWRGFPYGQPI